jgi:hypothetical protein
VIVFAFVPQLLRLLQNRNLMTANKLVIDPLNPLIPYASCAVSTAPSISSAGSHRRKRRQVDSPDYYDESVLRPLVLPIQELAGCQRQLVVVRSDNRRQERHLQQRTNESTERGLWRERHFHRKAELSDLARKCRKLNLELDPNAEQSARLSEFYVHEGRLSQCEIRQLEKQQQQHQRPANEPRNNSD